MILHEFQIIRGMDCNVPNSVELIAASVSPKNEVDHREIVDNGWWTIDKLSPSIISAQRRESIEKSSTSVSQLTFNAVNLILRKTQHNPSQNTRGLQ